MGCAKGSGKRGWALIPTLARWLPAPFDNVTDFPNAPCVGRGNALPVRATVAIGIEAMCGRAKHVSLLRRGHGGSLAIFSRHSAIERCQSGVAAHRDFAPRSRIRAAEAWARCARLGR